MAISVIVAVGAAADPLIAKIKERIGALKVGPGDQPDIDMGPLVTREHRDKVAGYIDKGEQEGATLLVAMSFALARALSWASSTVRAGTLPRD